MNNQEVLINLDLGNSVAEFDKELERHFVENDAFRALIEDKADIIAGDKGTGKTAIYKYFLHRTASAKIPELADIVIITGFNPSGSPVFQGLAYTRPLTEGQYITVWKTYILCLVGNWLLEFLGCDYSENTRKLDLLLNRIGLRCKDDTAATVFSRLIKWIQRLINPKNTSLEVTFDALGIPIITPKLEFGSQVSENEVIHQTDFILHDDALNLLNSSLTEYPIKIWIALDRLDEAFVGFTDVELPALRALLRTYLDLLAFKQIKLKLFVRKGLFRKITDDRFVNLTHVNARKREIIWDEEDLFKLLCKRIRECKHFLTLVNLHNATHAKTFAKTLIDIGFFEQVGESYRIPILYREGLNINKGKAFRKE